MELTIAHLYPDSMSLYGEYANVAVLRRHLEAMGVTVAVQCFTSEDVLDFSGADFIYMGAGTEKRQKGVLAAAPRYAPALKAAVERGVVVLFTGNAMETLGASVTDAKDQVWPGFGLADFTTKERDGWREPHDVLANTSLWDSDVIGFMNKCSTTHGVTTPLFEHVRGFGNEESCEPEGYVSGNVFATHLTGPMLVKNPDFLDLIIRRLFMQKGWEIPEQLPILPHEREAYAVTLRELRDRIK